MYTSWSTNNQIKEKSNVYLKEVATGVYRVEKDIFCGLPYKFTDASDVVYVLNKLEGVTVETLSGEFVYSEKHIL